jgi:hypothetical protein
VLDRHVHTCAKFYDFSKEAVAGTIGGGGDSPEFLVEVANRYYPEKYQVPVRLQQGHLSLISNCHTSLHLSH